jgi:hypothetical protein
MRSHVFRQTSGVARRILTEYLRQRRTLIFWAAFPALMLQLFGLIYADNPSMPGSIDTTPAGILIEGNEGEGESAQRSSSAASRHSLDHRGRAEEVVRWLSSTGVSSISLQPFPLSMPTWRSCK